MEIKEATYEFSAGDLPIEIDITTDIIEGFLEGFNLSSIDVIKLQMLYEGREIFYTPTFRGNDFIPLRIQGRDIDNNYYSFSVEKIPIKGRIELRIFSAKNNKGSVKFIWT